MVDFKSGLEGTILTKEDSLKSIVDKEDKAQKPQGVFDKAAQAYNKICQYGEELFECVANFLISK